MSWYALTMVQCEQLSSLEKRKQQLHTDVGEKTSQLAGMESQLATAQSELEALTREVGEQQAAQAESLARAEAEQRSVASKLLAVRTSSAVPHVPCLTLSLADPTRTETSPQRAWGRVSNQRQSARRV